MAISNTNMFRQIPQDTRRDTDDGSIVLDRDGSFFYYLNGTGAFVLDLCDGRHTVGDIADLLMSTYGLDQRPLDEVCACVEGLLARKLIARATITERLRRSLSGSANDAQQIK